MMSKKRKDDGCSRMQSGDECDEERKGMMELTKVAKSWDFTCSFCFKKFPSAQAMGGHQNAHRSQRLEEKKLFVRDPIAYRKRAFLRAIKADDEGGGGGGGNCVNNFNDAEDAAAAAAAAEEEEEEEEEDEVEVEKGKTASACIEFDVGGYGITLDHNLDLTLKL